jgi:hypothetical protein
MAWLYILITVVAGCFFYWLRSRHRWLYGITELLIALVIIILTWVPHGEIPYVIEVEHTVVPLSDILLPKIVNIFVGV